MFDGFRILIDQYKTDIQQSFAPSFMLSLFPQALQLMPSLHHDAIELKQRSSETGRTLKLFRDTDNLTASTL